MPRRFNVLYDYNGVTHTYLQLSVGYNLANMWRNKLAEKYLNPDGTGKTYPNGQGKYPITNIRIESVTQ